MARGTCWQGFEQKGFKKKGNRSVPNCVRAGKAKGGLAQTSSYCYINEKSWKKTKEKMKRIPRKKGQPVGSKKHSDLYTDENPKGTIQGLKFKTETDAKNSVAKIRKSGKTRAHKIQAAVAMEQRAGVMGKASSAGVYRKFIDSTKRTKKSKGGIINMTKMKYI